MKQHSFLILTATDEGNGYESEAEGDDDLDVDSTSGFETYTWAGQTRIRATSLVEGGLRGAGFMTITSADEDLELVSFFGMAAATPLTPAYSK